METHGYRVKSQFSHLMPQCYGRNDDYYYTAYCLPDYNIVYQKAMNDLLHFHAEDREYYGAFNQTLQ